MTVVAVQIGHKNDNEGATHEIETLEYVFPHVLHALDANGYGVKAFDGSLRRHPPNMQHKADGAIFLHCDSASSKSSGFSIGYWEELHPGSRDYAECIRKAYAERTKLKFGGYNITTNEHRYYGNWRFVRRCKCALIELGFVSNPKERLFLQNNARLVGHAVAAGIMDYFKNGKEIDEEDDMEINTSGSHVKYFATHGYIGALAGKNEDIYAKASNVSRKDTIVTFKCTNASGKSEQIPHTLKPGAYKEVKCSKFRLTGAVLVEMSADQPILMSFDHRRE
ncbi:MAG: N-acetylmuramoyl-L-alanine amidase [Sphaerochaetaceae bacterium]|nr:N-acetylmuramoyl-L-alanine amidase [Sphaerochaetaceae bacterium]